MMFHVSGILARFTDYQRDIQVEAATLGEAVDRLIALYPELGPVIRTADAKVRRAHKMFLNGDEVGESLDASVGQADRVEIVTAIAGG